MQPFGISNLTRKVFGKIVPVAITLAVVLLVYLLPQDDFKIVLVFALFVFVFSSYRFDTRIPIIFAVFLLIIAGVLTSQKADASVKLLAIVSYWLLVVGIICSLIDLCRKKGPIQTVA